MPRKSRKRSQKTRKQKVYVMRGCSKSKSCKNKRQTASLGCPKCGPNCHCGPNCKCSHNCSGNCYLNRQNHKGGSNSGCGSCGCPIAPYKMNQYGGSCGACGLQSGGNFFKAGSNMPGPIVGQSWGASTNELPGMDGVSNNRNYLSPSSNVIDNDPQLKMTMNASGYTGYKMLNSIVGGKKRKQPKSKRRNKSMNKLMKAGGLIPQDLVNLGNDFSFNLKSAYNAINGYKAPIDPLPYKDQLSHSMNNKILV
jgi:hypothetical protein